MTVNYRHLQFFYGAIPNFRHKVSINVFQDVYAETSKACGVHADILQIVSYAGCCLSITGLSLTIFTYMFFR